MRPIVQLSIAAAVVAASAGAALAIPFAFADGHARFEEPGPPVILNSYASFSGSPNMNVTHTWTIQGGEKGKTQFAIQSGTCGLLEFGAQLNCSVTRTAPTAESAFGSSFGIAQIDRKSHTKYTYTAGANSARPPRRGATSVQILARQDELVGPLVRYEDPTATPTYHPIGGTVTLTRGETTLTGRSQRGLTSYRIDVVSKYRGTIVGGPNDGRTVRGEIVVRARGLPRKIQ